MRTLLVIAYLLLANQAIAATYWASPTGSGSTCSYAAPCSLTGAQTVVRAVVASPMTEHAVVRLRGGTYPLAATFALASADSGRDGYTVTYAAALGEVPVLDGSQAITGWEAHTGGIFKAAYSGDAFRQLYVNGTHRDRARGASSAPPNDDKIADYANWVTTAAGMTAPDATMATWGNQSTIEFVFQPRLGFWQHRFIVASISGRDITMQTPGWTMQAAYSGSESPSYVENAYELMSSDHWYLDPVGHYLYYWPPSGSMSGLTVQAPGSLETLVSVTGASHLAIVGVMVQGSTWLGPSSAAGYASIQSGAYYTDGSIDTWAEIPPAVLISGSHSVTFAQNYVTMTGGRGLTVNSGSEDVAVIGNLFTETAGGAIQVGSLSPERFGVTAYENRITVADNLIPSGDSFDYTPATPLWLVSPTNSTIARNEVIDALWSGIGLGWSWSFDLVDTYASLITGNRIERYCHMFHDCGGIYINGTQASDGTFATGTNVAGNAIFHGEPDANAGVSAGGCLYGDQGSRWITWTANVCHNYPGGWVWCNNDNPPGLGNLTSGNYVDTLANNCSSSDYTDPKPSEIISTAVQPYGTPAGRVECSAGVAPGVRPGTFGASIRRTSRCTPPRAVDGDGLTVYVPLSEGARATAYNFAADVTRTVPTVQIGTWHGMGTHYTDGRAAGSFAGSLNGTDDYVEFGNNQTGSFLTETNHEGAVYFEDFEGGANGWADAGAAPPTLASDAASVYGPAAIVDSSVVSGGHYFSPTFATTIGQQYCAQMSVRWNGVGATPFIGIGPATGGPSTWIAGGCGYAELNVSSSVTGWQEFGYTFTATASQSRFGVELFGGCAVPAETNSAIFDGFSVASGPCTTISRAPIIPRTGPFTVVAWVKPTTDEGATQVVLSQLGGGTDGTALAIGSDPWKAGVYRPASAGMDAAWTWSTATAAYGEWHFIAATRSGAVWSVYLDDNTPTVAADAAAEREIAPLCNVLGAARLATPGACNAPDSFFGGAIEGLRVYGRALTTHEVLAIYGSEQ